MAVSTPGTCETFIAFANGATARSISTDQGVTWHHTVTPAPDGALPPGMAQAYPGATLLPAPLPIVGAVNDQSV
jgi:hypothetical protein